MWKHSVHLAHGVCFANQSPPGDLVRVDYGYDCDSGFAFSFDLGFCFYFCSSYSCLAHGCHFDSWSWSSGALYLTLSDDLRHTHATDPDLSPDSVLCLSLCPYPCLCLYLCPHRNPAHDFDCLSATDLVLAHNHHHGGALVHALSLCLHPHPHPYPLMLCAVWLHSPCDYMNLASPS